MILGQGLYVTAVGMGLVFLSLAILYLAVKVLDRLFPAREDAATSVGEPAVVSPPAAERPGRSTLVAPSAAQALADGVLEARLAGRLHRIQVGQPGEDFQRIVLDGTEHQVGREAGSPDGLVIDGRTYRASVLEAGDRLIKVRVGDTSYEIELPLPAPAPLETPASPASPVPPGGESVPAPLPGRILRVLVKPAEKVERGQELCVIEAMKMENSIRAPRDGVVGEVLVRAGQSVAAGEKLLYL